MKIALVLLAFILQANLIAQTNTPQDVYSIIKVYKTYDWYTTQAGLWEAEVKKTKKNSKAWTNYYTATRMAKIMSPNDTLRTEWAAKMESVINQMEKAIPNTFTYYHLKSWQSNIWGTQDPAKLKEMIGWAEKAYQLDSNNAAIYPDLMNAYLIQGTAEEMTNLSKQWLLSGDFDPNLLALTYNMFASTEKNAILITAGDNDTYPAYALQYGQNLRKDITVMNSFCAEGSKLYRNRMLTEMGIATTETPFENKIDLIKYIIKNRGDRPVYFAYGTYMDNEDSLKDKLYNTGLTLKYSDKEINNSSILIHNFEHKFLLDHLKLNLYNAKFPEQVKRHNLTYVPGLMQVYNYYCAIDATKKADATEILIRKIIAGTPHEANVLPAFNN